MRQSVKQPVKHLIRPTGMRSDRLQHPMLAKLFARSIAAFNDAIGPAQQTLARLHCHNRRLGIEALTIGHPKR